MGAYKACIIDNIESELYRVKEPIKVLYVYDPDTNSVKVFLTDLEIFACGSTLEEALQKVIFELYNMFCSIASAPTYIFNDEIQRYKRYLNTHLEVK